MPYADPEQRKRYAREWVVNRRREFFADKACECCGTVAELELHHRDPNQKVSHSIWSWSPARRAVEIAKCRVLCRGCHDRFHAEARLVEAQLRNPCGTYAAYKRGCTCEPCRAANRDYQRIWTAERPVAEEGNAPLSENTEFAGNPFASSADGLLEGREPPFRSFWLGVREGRER